MKLAKLFEGRFCKKKLFLLLRLCYKLHGGKKKKEKKIELQKIPKLKRFR